MHDKRREATLDGWTRVISSRDFMINRFPGRLNTELTGLGPTRYSRIVGACDLTALESSIGILHSFRCPGMIHLSLMSYE